MSGRHKASLPDIVCSSLEIREQAFSQLHTLFHLAFQSLFLCQSIPVARLHGFDQHLCPPPAGVDDVVADMCATVVDSMECVVCGIHAFVDLQVAVGLDHLESTSEVDQKAVNQQRNILAFTAPVPRLVRRVPPSLASSVEVVFELQAGCRSDGRLFTTLGDDGGGAGCGVRHGGRNRVECEQSESGSSVGMTVCAGRLWMHAGGGRLLSRIWPRTGLCGGSVVGQRPAETVKEGVDNAEVGKECRKKWGVEC